jgi:hypothetical protein
VAEPTEQGMSLPAMLIARRTASATEGTAAVRAASEWRRENELRSCLWPGDNKAEPSPSGLKRGKAGVLFEAFRRYDAGELSPFRMNM